MKNSKCMYCGSKVKKQIQAKDVLNERELSQFAKIKRDRIVCDDCSVQMLYMNIF